MSSSSEDEGLDDLDFDGASEAEHEIDEDILGALEEHLAADASEVDEVTATQGCTSESYVHGLTGFSCSFAGYRYRRLGCWIG